MRQVRAVIGEDGIEVGWADQPDEVGAELDALAQPGWLSWRANSPTMGISTGDQIRRATAAITASARMSPRRSRTRPSRRPGRPV